MTTTAPRVRASSPLIVFVSRPRNDLTGSLQALGVRWPTVPSRTSPCSAAATQRAFEKEVSMVSVCRRERRLTLPTYNSRARAGEGSYAGKVTQTTK